MAEEVYAIDASVIIARLLNEPQFSLDMNNLLDRAISGEVRLIAPDLLPYEVANVLKLTGKKNKFLTKQKLIKLFDLFLQMPIVMYPMRHMQIFPWSLDKDLTYYDSAYLFLCKSKKSKLLSFDTQLLKYSK